MPPPRKDDTSSSRNPNADTPPRSSVVSLAAADSSSSLRSTATADKDSSDTKTNALEDLEEGEHRSDADSDRKRSVTSEVSTTPVVPAKRRKVEEDRGNERPRVCLW